MSVVSKKNVMKVKTWDTLNWRAIELFVRKIQRLIYIAVKEQDHKQALHWQRVLLRSKATKYMAVRRVTQDSRGKRTAGIDGVKLLTPKQRMELARKLQLDGKADTIRRIHIPKPGKTEKRPLGIPTIRDRAKQAYALLVLEPAYEANFEANSYGFRPGRNCHDALQAIFLAIAHKAKYVLDADIAKCFDTIDHEALITKLELTNFPEMELQIRAWLKAGILDGDVFHASERGTPQGGVLSPLLANCALNGMEGAVLAHIKTLDLPKVTKPKGSREAKASVIRYADDFVVLHPQKEAIESCQIFLENWLAKMGLKLNAEKTRIVHTLQDTNGQTGFDFLGFTIRQFTVGKYRVKKGKTKARIPFRTIIQVSRSKTKAHIKSLRTILYAGTQVMPLLAKLNPKITGWSNYFSFGAGYRILSWCDYRLYQLLMQWMRNKHPARTYRWRAA
jgi:RNA-directed DNA polymerase